MLTRKAAVIKWGIRQNLAFSIGQSKIPNPFEIALVTYFALMGGLIAAVISYSLIWLIAWSLGKYMIYSGFYEYEQRYVSELNPVLMEIRRKR